MIDLCVVNYNTKPNLEKLLDTLHSDSTNPKNWKLYITDNGSIDGTVKWIKKHINKYLVDRLLLKKNNGYAFACNYMASKSNSDIIGFLNADVWLTSNDVQKIQKVFDENPHIHILGPKLRNEEHRIVHAGIVGNNSYPEPRGWMELDENDKLYKDRIECIAVSGSAFFIRRHVWNVLTNHPKYKRIFDTAAGAFLPTPHYYEDIWCSYFARFLGYKVFYDGSISLGHTFHASSPLPDQSNEAPEYKLLPISREMFIRTCEIVGVQSDIIFNE